MPPKTAPRPSPSVHAAEHPNEVMKGNDGKKYVSVADKNGAYRWRKATTAGAASPTPKHAPAAAPHSPAKKKALAAVRKNGRDLERFPAFQDDRDVVLAAVKQDREALQNVSAALRNDREVIQTAIKSAPKDGWIALAHASAALQDDDELARMAATRDRLTLLRDGKYLRGDKKFMLAAVKTKGYLLVYASRKLKGDKDLVKVATTSWGYALQFASDALKNDRSLVLGVVETSGGALEYASEALRADREVVRTALEENGFALELASAALRNDREIVMEVVKGNAGGDGFRMASDGLRDDKEMVLAAVAVDKEAFAYASERLKKDPDVLAAKKKRRKTEGGE